MIIKGNPAGHVGYWSRHLQRDDTNDRAEVVEISGLLATNLPTALREMEAIAAQSRSQGLFMYQANINPEIGERLTEKQWRESIDTLENHLGLSGHQRVVVEHEKEGRIHRHVVWNRVDVDTLRVTDIGGNYYTHELVARTLELKFDLQRTASLHGEHRPEGRPERAPELSELRAAERSGIDPKQIKTEITDLWRTTDSGKALAAAIEERGYILAQGDRRDFCIVDQAGDAHSLARLVEGVKTKEVRERLADIDRAALATVDEARAAQREKNPTHDAARAAWEGRTETVASQATGQEQTTPREQERPVTDDRTPPHEAPDARTEAPASQAPQHEPSYPREPHRPVPDATRHEQTPPNEPERSARDATPPPREVWQQRAATKLEERIFHIQDAAERGGPPVAARLYAEGITLARADQAGMVQYAFDQRFDAVQDAAKGEVRLIRDTFAEGELVAVMRNGNVQRINPQYIDLPRLEQSACGNSPAPPLSATLEFFATDRASERAEKANTNAEFLEKRQQGQEFREAAREVTDEAKATQRERREAVHDIKGAAFTVKDTATGAVCSLSSFVEKLMNLFGGGPVLTEGDMIVRQRRAAAAMESIQESFERGDSLSSSDIQNLTPTHIENLYRGGDAYMRELIDGIKRWQERDYDHSRSRD